MNLTLLTALIPLLPLAGFLINGLGRNSLSKGLAGTIGSATVLGSFILSLLIFFEVKSGHTGTVQLFDFISYDKVSIPFAFQVDQLSALFLLIITGIGFLIHVYSTAYMQEEEPSHFARYFAYLNLFVFSMLLLVLGANYVVMFIGWEGVGLCSYLLIGFWFKNQGYNNAAKKAFIMNRIGDLGVLLAVFWMLQKFGSATFAGDAGVLAQAAKLSINDPALVGITLLLFVGATGKSAQIPLYTWLPDAMAGPTPVSALIHAATMVTAGIYMIARSNIMFSLAHTTMQVIAIIGLATALLAATIAIKQNDIKKVLAYSTVSQLGFMFLALGTGNYVAAVFHVMTHAFFKALMFLGAGSVIHGMHHEQDIRNMGGLKKYMPVTHITFLIGCLAISGIPPFSGFFSKDSILLGAFENNMVLYVIAALTAMLTAFYMFRLYFITFQGQFRGSHGGHHHTEDHKSTDDHTPHESPKAITVPLIILAVLSLIGGFVGVPAVLRGHDEIAEFLSPIISHKAEAAVSHSTELTLMAVATVLAIIAIGIAYSLYKNFKPKTEEETGLGKVLQNKWYVDELYDAIIVRPVKVLGDFSKNVIEKSGIDRLVNGVGRGIQYSSRQFRHLQSGVVGNYVLIMVVVIIVLFLIGFKYSLDLGSIKGMFGGK